MSAPVKGRSGPASARRGNNPTAKSEEAPRGTSSRRRHGGSRGCQRRRRDTVVPPRSDRRLVALCYDRGLYGERDLAIRIGTVGQIVAQLAVLNDWHYLVQMGREMGPKRDQPKLDRLEKLLNDCTDRKTLEQFRLEISTGELGCLMCAESPAEFAEMKRVILSAPSIDDTIRAKVSALLDQLDAFFGPGGGDPTVVERICSRQYLTTGVARDDYLG